MRARRWSRLALAGLLLLLAGATVAPSPRRPFSSSPCRPVAPSLCRPVALSPRLPVILDTDIGDDIDDTWALGFLLKCPELDLKLVVGDNGKARYRARLLARFLTVVGRTDVPVGIGLRPDDPPGNQSAWIQGFELKAYRGKVYADGVQAIIDTIRASPRPVTVIGIGPAPNLAEALRRRPAIARNARLIGMYGSVRRGYDGSHEPAAEWNVKADPAAARAALTAPWDVTITPLDTCGLIRLEGERFARVRDSRDPVAAAIIENYRLWLAAQKQGAEAPTASSTLFDTVAVYLALAHPQVKIEDLRLRVTDDGRTVLDPAGKPTHVATEWINREAFEELLVQRITAPQGGRISRTGQ